MVTAAAIAGDSAGSRPKALLACIDPTKLGPGFAGRDFDEALLADLPASVDPCVERDEFHTFAYVGPMFGAPLRVHKGEVVERDGFIFADTLPD
jgi:diphthamide synthase (EF-2-diphthine--ammonia ligase)